MSLLLNLAVEASSIFLPLYAQSLGASNLEVGFIAATYGLAFFSSSFFFGRQSDIRGRLAFIRSGLGLSVIAYLSQIVTASPAALMAARGFIGFCLGITSGATIAYTYENQGHVGRFVAYGSLGWLCGALAAAALRNYEALFVTSAVTSALAFLVSLTLREEPGSRVRVAVFTMPVIRANARIYFAFLFRQVGANAVWAIFPLFLVDIGASRLWIAILDGISMGGQFILMRFVERFNPVKAFRTGLLASAMVFAAYGIATHYLQLVPVQVLLALAWSCLFVGALSYLLRKNVERGTASGLLYSTMYLSAGIGPFLGGPISQVWEFRTVMYVASALTFVGFWYSRGLNHSVESSAKSLESKNQKSCRD